MNTSTSWIIFLVFVLSSPVFSASREEREQARAKKEYYEQREELREKFELVQEKFDLLIGDYDNAKIEGRDSIGQWKSYQNRFKREFGRARNYYSKTRFKFDNLKMVNDTLKDLAGDIPDLVEMIGKNIEDARDEKTISLEESITRRLEGISGILDIEKPVLRRGSWTPAGPVRWKVINARRKTRDKYTKTRLATVRFKVQITDEIMKRLEGEGMMLLSANGEKLYPIMNFGRAKFAYSEKERPPFGDWIEATRVHTFTAVFRVGEKEREFILRVSDLERAQPEYSYVSVRL
ncbi:MAG: hypothetical protein QF437_28520 [Planctomycetota bacterium]|jgi:hypothetical protein|nr:hypothetical protein [Planctomycetota bacterium]